MIIFHSIQFGPLWVSPFVYFSRHDRPGPGPFGGSLPIKSKRPQGIPTAPWSWCCSFTAQTSHICTSICRYGAIGIFLGTCSEVIFLLRRSWVTLPPCSKDRECNCGRCWSSILQQCNIWSSQCVVISRPCWKGQQSRSWCRCFLSYFRRERNLWRGQDNPSFAWKPRGSTWQGMDRRLKHGASAKPTSVELAMSKLVKSETCSSLSHSLWETRRQTSFHILWSVISSSWSVLASTSDLARTISKNIKSLDYLKEETCIAA